MSRPRITGGCSQPSTARGQRAAHATWTAKPCRSTTRWQRNSCCPEWPADPCRGRTGACPPAIRAQQNGHPGGQGWRRLAGATADITGVGLDVRRAGAESTPSRAEGAPMRRQPDARTITSGALEQPPQRGAETVALGDATVAQADEQADRKTKPSAAEVRSDCRGQAHSGSRQPGGRPPWRRRRRWNRRRSRIWLGLVLSAPGQLQARTNLK